MDYLERAALKRHINFDSFEGWRLAQRRRLILLTTKSDRAYTGCDFEQGDILLMGRESTGVPDAVHTLADDRLTIPMAEGMRSLNVAVSCGMVLGEALRQTRAFPKRTG
jgi:tRNA (cytidine/uridine-2'-O-)-methyltransferase